VLHSQCRIQVVQCALRSTMPFSAHTAIRLMQAFSLQGHAGVSHVVLGSCCELEQ
jgi:hypothetical protein